MAGILIEAIELRLVEMVLELYLFLHLKLLGEFGRLFALDLLQWLLLNPLLVLQKINMNDINGGGELKEQNLLLIKYLLP